MSSGRRISIELPLFLSEGEAACSEIDPELFFPQDGEDLPNGRSVAPTYKNLAAARAICDSCELKARCLEYALRNDEYGVWGGLTEMQRSNLRRKVGISFGRKRKTPDLW